MNQRCGLVNTKNPCRCHKKAKAYVTRGAVDPERLVFNSDYTLRIAAWAQEGASAALDKVEELHRQVFLEHPLQISRARVVEDVLSDEVLRRFFDI